MKSQLKNIFFVLIGLSLFAFALTKVEPLGLWEELKKARLIWILLAIFSGVLSHVIRAVRWNQLLIPLGYKVTFLNAFASVMAAYVVNYAIPRSGEVLRCGMLHRSDKVPIQKSLGTVLIERFVDLLALMLITLLILLRQFDIIQEFFHANGTNPSPLIFLAIGFVFLLIGYVFWKKKAKDFQHPLLIKIIQFLSGLQDGVRSISKLKNPTLFIGYSFLIWVGYFLSSYFTLFALEGTSNLGFDAALTILFTGSVAVIITPGGTGAFHLMVAKALVLYGIKDQTIGLAYSTLTHTTQMIGIFSFGLISYILFLLKQKRN